MVANTRMGREQTLPIFLTGGCGSGISAYFFDFTEFLFWQISARLSFSSALSSCSDSRLLQQPNQRHKWSIEISIGFEYLVLQASASKMSVKPRYGNNEKFTKTPSCDLLISIFSSEVP